MLEQVKNTPLLIIDDLGSQINTPWAEEKLLQIINHRFYLRLPTVFTINGPLEDMPERLYSRLTDLNISSRYVVEEKPGFNNVGESTLELLQEMTFDNFILKITPLGHERADLEIARRQSNSLENAYQAAVRYAENPERWLVLAGSIGCGKTHLAAAIANHRYKLGQSAIFVVVPDLLDDLRATYSPDSHTTFDRTFEGLKQCPLLILDDLGAQASSPWAKEKLFRLINHRHNGRLPTVVTTNLSSDEMMKETDLRIVSRLMDRLMSDWLVMEAPDYRQPGRTSTRQQVQRGRSANKS